jgi:hypothetical protein
MASDADPERPAMMSNPPVCQSKLHVDIGQPDITVEQQDAASGARYKMRQCSREPGFPYAALAGGNGDEVIFLGFGHTISWLRLITE